MQIERESMEYDVVIIGAGPSGLTAAIHIKQLCQKFNTNLSVCILEKGAQVGSHILSGAVLEPSTLFELFPDITQLKPPLNTPVVKDRFYYLTEKKAYRLPTPHPMRNQGNYIISLGQLCRWLAKQAEQLGVEIYPGFSATELLYDEQGYIKGVGTADLGIDKKGHRKSNFQAGIHLLAKQTVFAEGCRGSLTQQLLHHFHLQKGSQAQTYGIGLKELWQINPEQHQAGTVIHTVGWPLDYKTYGGSFLYHLENNRVSLGFVIGLDYKNPWLNPFEELQRFKNHPLIEKTLTGGERIEYGARALNEGGYQSIPQSSFPGGVIIGDGAGFLNVPKIKGIHTAIKSAMIAANSIYNHIQSESSEAEVKDYQINLKQSALYKELHRVRNIRPAFRWGLWPGLAYAAIDTYLLRGKAPWTFNHAIDHLSLKKASDCKKIKYPAHNRETTFDKLDSVYLSGTYHEEDQPCHLKLKDQKIPIENNLKYYQCPEQRYCPAGVYEIIYDADQKASLQINASNCIHCKVCDIKDPCQNIIWVSPEGGGGSNYSNM